MDLIEELSWRGLLQEQIPGTKEHLLKGQVTGYVGFDPTADSLHIGNLVPIMLLVHLQRAGHKPLALVGGATGMIGDPSGKSEERNLLTEEVLRHNEGCIKKQLEKFLDFNSSSNSAEIVNNYDWFSGMRFLDFIRDVGKHITVNYMLSKESVQKRLETGISFTEFSYQLIQGFDYYHLFTEKNCTLQMGGSDQWGNMLTGTELIRRKASGEAFAIISPLITKSDGGKFGKSEKGNVWLDKNKTSPYQFYQFWLNVTDEEASKYIRIFSLLDKEEIEDIEKKHNEAPHLRLLQKALAEDVTIRVHSREDYQAALDTSSILFGQGTTETLKNLSETDFLSAFEGVPTFNIPKNELEAGLNVVDLLGDKTNVFPSKGEARKMIQAGGVSINKMKITDISDQINSTMLLNNKYLLAQKGKKNYFLIVAG